MRASSVTVALLAAVVLAPSAQAQSEIATVTEAAPAQPNALPLPAPDTPDREIWHRSAGLLAVRNVSHPTLTVFRPTGKPNGAAVIVAPGGAFLGLEMDKEGWEVARRLAAHGVTAFVLKYRTLPTPADQKIFVAELGKMITGQKAAFAPPSDTPPEALADGIAALRFVRQHAEDYAVDPHRLGFMGFSAGGFLTRSVVEKGGTDRPDFAAPIYPNMASMQVPADAPPMFVAIATDDFLLNREKGLPLVDAYRAAGRPLEFHLFADGGHGFGAGKAGTATAHWLDQFFLWLDVMGLTKSAK
ncbi:alpha/beta hydrolase [Sphingomonas pokkalii]|uniref:Alpha/beta hydrolase n=1 Tax=Sphingomonas pokkalii TaxID=2175090 RepID=A0A2U0SC42_9SPHN|nr:alpha/beta hydrolase [Sphingomonas pokkalii]PVX28884.1 alpha/beta hydrolase [Sphingomonas pokkalii]